MESIITCKTNTDNLRVNKISSEISEFLNLYLKKNFTIKEHIIIIPRKLRTPSEIKKALFTTSSKTLAKFLEKENDSIF